MSEQEQPEQEVSHKEFILKRIGGQLHKIISLKDSKDNVFEKIVIPFPVEFTFRDAFQVLAGASLMMVPVALTEEVWTLSEELPLINVQWLVVLSILTIALFVYFNFYKSNLKGHVIDYFKRTIFTYVIALFAAGVFLTIIDKCPWGIDNLLAIKRIIFVAFPASMSGTISDTLK